MKEENLEHLIMNNQITFEDFKKLDIRIGTIISAEKVEGTDKLLKLEIDIGSQKRQLVAGIAQFYSVEQLIDKQIPVIVNLEPKQFRGVESQGMMLAADMNGKPVLLHPSEKIPPGIIVK